MAKIWWTHLQIPERVGNLVLMPPRTGFSLRWFLLVIVTRKPHCVVAQVYGIISPSTELNVTPPPPRGGSFSDNFSWGLGTVAHSGGNLHSGGVGYIHTLAQSCIVLLPRQV